jgi:Caspase domain
MKLERKAKRIRASLLLVALCVLLLVSMLPGHEALWAQSKGFNVQGRGSTGGERRVALVIGNAAYDSAPLRNPVNDARAMATTLRTLGFEVTALENAALTDMKRAIDDFGDSLRSGGGVGLFYFSGHGIQINGRNFIIPVGVRVKGERDVEYESVDVGRVLGKMEDAGNRMNLVILDACRDNPFARSFRSAASGLASIEAASGTFVAYATAPGRTADDGTGANGLYTEQLVRYMRTPGLKVEDVFKLVRIDVEKSSGGKQVPWESSSLKGDFYFSGVPVEAALPTPPSSLAKPAGPARTIDEEEALWKVIESSTNPVDFEEYLSAFPQGRFVVAARVKLRQLRREESLRSAAVVVRTGNYRVQGTNPNGSAYQGTLTIERSGPLYLVRWKIGKDSYEGQGTLNGSTLTIDWGQPDPVIYQVMNDGTLEGTWAKGRGKESLTPEQ